MENFRFIFLLLSIYFPFISFSQGLNNIIYGQFTPERYYDIEIQNDTILTLGVGFSEINGKRIQGIVFTQFDSMGTIVKSKIFMDTIRGTLSVHYDYGNIIKLRNNSYVCIVAVHQEETVLFLHLDKYYNIKLIKDFEGGTLLTNFDYKVVAFQDGYLLYGAVQYPPKIANTNGQVVGFVKRIDELGNILWEKEYKPSLLYNDVVDLKLCTDSSFVLLVNSQNDLDFDPAVFNSLYLVDKEGKTLNTWKSKVKDDNYLNVFNIVDATKDTLLVFGHRFVDYYAPKARNNQPFIGAFNTNNLEPYWQQDIGVKTYSIHYFNRLVDFTKTKDNHFVGVGNMTLDPKDDNKIFTWLCKFNRKGETLWSRKIRYVSNLPDNVKNELAGNLTSVATLSSGSIIATGFVSVANKTYGYLVKMTNEGCLDTLFKCDKTIATENIKGIEEINKVVIFPNPLTANQTLKIRTLCAEDMNVKMKLYTLTGQVVSEQNAYLPKGENIQTLLTNPITKGVYFLETSFGAERNIQRIIVQ